MCSLYFRTSSAYSPNTVYSIIYNDIWWPQLYLTPPLTPIATLAHSLPSADDCWNAPTAQKWYEAMQANGWILPFNGTLFYKVSASILLTEDFNTVFKQIENNSLSRAAIIGFFLMVILSTKAKKYSSIDSATNDAESEIGVFVPIKKGLNAAYGYMPSVSDYEPYQLRNLWHLSWFSWRE